MTEARSPRERPQGRAVGAPGPSWAGDGELADEPAPRDVERPVASAVAIEHDRPAGPAGLELASFGRRLAGFAVDNVLVIVVLLTFNAIIGLNASSLTEAETRVFSLVNILVQFVYWWVWNTLGWSPGKRVVGLRVVDEDGAAPGLDRGFRRTVMSLVSQLALFAGYLWALRDGRNQTWHDKAGGTFVVIAPAEEQRPV